MVLILSAPAHAQEMSDRFTLVIHGGAGNITTERLSADERIAYEAAIRTALEAGGTILQKGGTAVDAVEAAIVVLENSPLFNAGKGAVFTSNGTNELDASIMDGSSLKAGAVAGATKIKNPIQAAKLVMLQSPHVLLSGDGANRFANEHGLPLVDSTYFYDEARFRMYQNMREKDILEQRQKNQNNDSEDRGELPQTHDGDYKFGTVGAVAIDRHGNMAAGTSTGGMTYKKWGRIGDSPIIGAGTYANNETCAVSCTGHGEFFIRSVVAYDISAKMEYEGADLEEAAQEVVQEKLPKLGGSGGIIAVDDQGNAVWEFNTAGMYRGSITESGWMEIGIFGKGSEISIDPNKE